MGQKTYKQLSLDERCTITCLHKEGQSIQKIAAALARSPSTISREIERNKCKTKGYDPAYAQLQTAGRRWQRSRLERQAALRSDVMNLLAMGWSPQQISNRLAQERGCKLISHESIYRFIYGQIKRTNDYRWRHYLPRAKSRRGFRGKKGGSPASFIKDRVPIQERAKQILKRESPGHWEADLMLFSQYGQGLLVVHERYSRLVMLFKLKNKKAKPISSLLMKLFSSLPKPLAQTMTVDNGTEFSEHYRLHDLGMKTYFCDVRSPWQKGGVENAIGRLRRMLPRKTNIGKVKEEELNQWVALYNHTPRKCLGYKTPAEIFKQLLHFECELTSQLALG